MREKYNTKQREKILQFLKENKDSDVTAEDILLYFSQNSCNIGKATVYRYLNSLVESNIIKKYMADGKNCWCFQYIEEQCCEHYHLKCERCNKIIHLDCDEFKRIEKHISMEHNFQLDSIKTVLYGVCNDCKKLGKETI